MINYKHEIGHIFLKIYNDTKLDMGDKGMHFDLIKALAEHSIDCLIEEKRSTEYKNKMIDLLKINGD